MPRLFLILVCLLAVTPAFASSLFLDDSTSTTLGPLTVIDLVVLSQTSHLSLEGATVGELTLLDDSTASLLSGSVGRLEVYENGTATIFGEVLLDAAPAPDPITALECPECQLTGTLVEGSLNAIGAVAQNGQIVVSQVPEPEAAILFGLGLVGLALADRRWLSVSA